MHPPDTCSEILAIHSLFISTFVILYRPRSFWTESNILNLGSPSQQLLVWIFDSIVPVRLVSYYRQFFILNCRALDWAIKSKIRTGEDPKPASQIIHIIKRPKTMHWM